MLTAGVVPVVGLEPTRCCHQRILSPHRLPFRHTGVRIAFILYYAAFVKSSVFCPQNAKKRCPAFFRPGAGPAFAAAVRRRFRLRKKIHGGGCRFRPRKEIHGGALPVPATQRDSRRAPPVPAAQRDSRRALPQQASHC